MEVERSRHPTWECRSSRVWGCVAGWGLPDIPAPGSQPHIPETPVSSTPPLSEPHIPKVIGIYIYVGRQQDPVRKYSVRVTMRDVMFSQRHSWRST